MIRHRRIAHGTMIRDGLILVICLILLSWGEIVGAAPTAEDFGAKGDGVTDDTTALQAALDARQGPVLLDPKRYRITRTLMIPSDSGMTGNATLYMDADETMLKNKGGAEGDRNISLKSVRLVKKFVENSERDGIFFENVKNVTIDSVEVTGMSACYGISLENSENFSIVNCYIHDFKTSWTQRKLPGGRNLDALGIRLYRCAFGQVVGNRIENLLVTEESADSMAWQTDGINPHTCRHVTIANNTIRNVGEGIDLVHCESMAVTGNAFENCWHFGIKIIHGTHLCAITGNTIRNAALAGISVYFGESSNGRNFGNSIVGNTIANTGGITRIDDKTEKGIWRTWKTCGIEIVNDNKPDNSVHEHLLAGNVIYDDQESPHCEWCSP